MKCLLYCRLLADLRPVEIGWQVAPYWLPSSLWDPRMLELWALKSLHLCCSRMSWDLFILCALSNHIPHESNLFVDASVLDWCFGGSFNDKRFIESLGLIAVKLESVLDFWPIEIYPAVIVFTGWAWLCHPCRWFWDITPTWLFTNSFSSPCNSSIGFALKSNSFGLADYREAQ